MALTTKLFASPSRTFVGCTSSSLGEGFRLNEESERISSPVSVLSRPVVTVATLAGVAAAVAVQPKPRGRAGSSRKVVCRCDAAELQELRRAMLEAQLQAPPPAPEDIVSMGDSAAGDAGSLTVVELEARLHAAVSLEHYEEAARLKKEIQERSFDAEAAVLAANRQFFEVCESRDTERMSDLWYQSDRSCCILPASKPVHGYLAIMEAWAGFFQNSRGMKDVKYSDHSVAIRDDIGRAVCCVTYKSGAVVVVTNHFECTVNGWKICCHQASTVDAPKKGSGVAALLTRIPSWFERRWRKRQEEALQKQLEREEEERKWQLASLSRCMKPVNA